MNKKKRPASADSKPQKVLLHMARKGGEWAGKATHFEREEQYTFTNLEDLLAWLESRTISRGKSRAKKSSRVTRNK